MALLPFLCFWEEVSYWGVMRKCCQHGSACRRLKPAPESRRSDFDADLKVRSTCWKRRSRALWKPQSGALWKRQSRALRTRSSRALWKALSGHFGRAGSRTLWMLRSGATCLLPNTLRVSSFYTILCGHKRKVFKTSRLRMIVSLALPTLCRQSIHNKHFKNRGRGYSYDSSNL